LRLIKSIDRSEPPTIAGRASSSLAAGLRTPRDQRSADSSLAEASENDILKDVIFAFQGIEGKFVKFDAVKEAFVIDPKTGLTKTVRTTVSKLVECGHLFGKVRKYADSHSTDRAFGLVGQSFCAALHQELTEYYRLIAVLAAQLQQDEDQGVVVSASPNCLTLRRLSVWMCEPIVRLKTLAALVDVCHGKKGGALASAVHSYMQHGDPAIRALVRHTLAIVVQPIFSTILRWIYEGELEDTYHEFFVASDPQVKDDRLWHDKYSLRAEMVPSFLTVDQAKKILLTGKAINFLRQVCQDRTLIRSREAVRIAEANRVESMFSQDLDGVFDKMVDTVYRETSRHLLHILHTKYKFMDHLKAMRRYLLLGQGDFIRHLMDLLEEDLAKPAQTLFLHNLTGILETAVRATNAQYDDADILKRLDVRLLEVSPGDTGWDVFSLEYHVSGHIRTVFTTECMMMYLRVFNFLWRAKRMEYILALIWRDQMANAKLLRLLPEVAPALHQCQLIVTEMLHFVQQVQYYINFEVLECSWDELLCKVKDAEDLDHIIAAHQEFLDAITTRSLLDQQSHGILTQLRTIFDLIINFQVIQENMYHAAKEELIARQRFEEAKTRNTEKGEWGVTEDEVEMEERRRVKFSQTDLSTLRSQLRILQQSYQNMVQQFLVMLTSHSDISLRFLSFRLDFNEHYRALELRARGRRTQQRKKT
jgi:gamma-tubulin complex component 3